jgi:hypothetical protein
VERWRIGALGPFVAQVEDIGVARIAKEMRMLLSRPVFMNVDLRHQVCLASLRHNPGAEGTPIIPKRNERHRRRKDG